MRISDWSSDVCSSDLLAAVGNRALECDDVLEDPAEAVRGIIPEHLLLVADLVDELLAGHAIDDAADCDDIAARRIDQAGSVEEARTVGRFIFQILVPFLRVVDRGGARKNTRLNSRH